MFFSSSLFPFPQRGNFPARYPEEAGLRLLSCGRYPMAIALYYRTDTSQSVVGATSSHFGVYNGAQWSIDLEVGNCF